MREWEIGAVENIHGALPYIRFAPILALVGVGVNRIGKDKGSGFPKAVVQYFDLDEYYYLEENFDFGTLINAMLSSKDGAINWGKEGSTRNAQGKIVYRMFEAGGSQCGAFIQYWGITGYIEGSSDKGFNGYYCSDPGRPLSSEEFLTALKSLKDVVPAKWSGIKGN